VTHIYGHLYIHPNKHIYRSLYPLFMHGYILLLTLLYIIFAYRWRFIDRYIFISYGLCGATAVCFCYVFRSVCFCIFSIMNSILVNCIYAKHTDTHTHTQTHEGNAMQFHLIFLVPFACERKTQRNFHKKQPEEWQRGLEVGAKSSLNASRAVHLFRYHQPSRGTISESKKIAGIVDRWVLNNTRSDI